MNLSAAYQGCDDKNVNILLAHQPVAAKIALKDSRFNFQLILSGLLILYFKLKKLKLNF